MNADARTLLNKLYTDGAHHKLRVHDIHGDNATKPGAIQADLSTAQLHIGTSRAGQAKATFNESNLTRHYAHVTLHPQAKVPVLTPTTNPAWLVMKYHGGTQGVIEPGEETALYTHKQLIKAMKERDINTLNKGVTIASFGPHKTTAMDEEREAHRLGFTCNPVYEALTITTPEPVNNPNTFYDQQSLDKRSAAHNVEIQP